VTAATTLPGLEERCAGALRTFAGGTGAPVVLLHGLGGAAANWGEVTEELARSYRVLAVDLPGHGGSPRPPAGAGIDWFADAVAEATGPAGNASGRGG
jgi:pimeloyl-ACP methyl ester carboxylesterase